MTQRPLRYNVPSPLKDIAKAIQNKSDCFTDWQLLHIKTSQNVKFPRQTDVVDINPPIALISLLDRYTISTSDFVLLAVNTFHLQYQKKVGMCL